MKKMTVSGAAIAAAAASLFLSGATIDAAAAKAAMGHCMGANSCKGLSACKGGRPGLNACKGQGFAMTAKRQCEASGHKFVSI